MPTGTDESWVAAPPDVPGLGDHWAQITGFSPDNPLVGGPGYGGLVQPDQRYERLVGGLGPSATAAAPDGSARGLAKWDDWRDLFDFKDSPTPWVLMALLVAVGLLSLRVQGRAGPASGALQIGR